MKKKDQFVSIHLPKTQNHAVLNTPKNLANAVNVQKA